DLCVPGATYTCEHQLTTGPGCCSDVDDCVDDDPCTTASCEDAQCTFETFCCVVDEDCDDDGDACTAASCVNELCETAYTLAVGCCEPIPHSATFEAGAYGWTFSGDAQGCSWHVEADGQALSGTHALHYADPATMTYACGASSGAATSPPITLSGGARVHLTASVWMDLDVDPAKNLLSLWLVSAQGEFVLWERTGSEPMQMWHTVSADLSAFAGAEVALQWRLDTIDIVSSDAAGVFVDDVIVTSPCSPLSCVTDSDCDDALAFTTETCTSGLCVWSL
ncbi:MAG: hypothetical protein QF464_18625, partial [Myxococcota bacterium]|nr:hypothetical protein [Myxococcota bacterium]